MFIVTLITEPASTLTATVAELRAQSVRREVRVTRGQAEFARTVAGADPGFAPLWVFAGELARASAGTPRDVVCVNDGVQTHWL